MNRAPITIDVSHIMGWRGNLTGIERVEFNIINHYFNNTDANFIRWDSGVLRFVSVDRTVVRSQILSRTSEEEQSRSQPKNTTVRRIKYAM